MVTSYPPVTIPSAPAIAISKAARARAHVRCSPAPKPRRLRRFVAASPIHVNSPTDTHACRKDHSLTHGCIARDQCGHRPDHSGAVSHLHVESGFRQTSVCRLALRRGGQPEARGAAILVAGRNIGCGSSREHAPWALQDFGFQAVVSTEFADIFRTNCLKNGLLPVLLDEKTHAWLLANPNVEVHIDVADCVLTLPDGTRVT